MPITIMPVGKMTATALFAAGYSFTANLAGNA